MPEDLIATAARSAPWALLARFSEIFGRSVVLLVLPYWLTPDDFGVITMVSSVMALLMIFQQAGLVEAVIQRERDVQEIREAAFWLGVLIGLSLFGVLFVLAPLVGLFFDEPRLTPVLRLIGLQIPLSSISMIPLAWMKRAFQFRRYALIQLASSLVMILMAVWGGMEGGGYWAYVVGLLSGSVLVLVLTMLFLEWHPGWRVRWRWWGEIGRFSAFVLAEMVLGWLFVWLDNVIVARQLGSEAAGVYSLTFNIASMAIALPLSAVTGVALPAFSRLQNTLARLRVAYLEGTRLIAAFAIPASFGLALLGPAILQNVYPQRWEDVGKLLPVLALYSGLGHLWALNTEAFKAIGAPDLILRIYVPVAFIMLPLYIWASKIGLFEFVIVRSLLVVVGAIPHTVFAVRYLGLQEKYLLDVVREPFLATLAMSVFVGSGMWIFTILRYLSSGLRLGYLLILTALGGGVYIGCLNRLSGGTYRATLTRLWDARRNYE